MGGANVVFVACCGLCGLHLGATSAEPELRAPPITGITGPFMGRLDALLALRHCSAGQLVSEAAFWAPLGHFGPARRLQRAPFFSRETSQTSRRPLGRRAITTPHRQTDKHWPLWATHREAGQKSSGAKGARSVPLFSSSQPLSPQAELMKLQVARE